ncbi:MAG TPA: MoxR family ATPase [Methylophilaceae bacterium]|nr:MoxR family ATPase [Methylophilaceae bacterium]
MLVLTKDNRLDYWRAKALKLEAEINKVIIGQERAVRLINIALFARGHVLLEGDVGVGKTTLLRAFARGIGGKYERAEGTVDLMPNDLIYHTYIGEDGRPRVDPGPLLRSGEDISIFFFNEINRARPQVHALMLRVMAERSLTAFKRDYHLPHMIVFADRNQVEKEETFEIPSAARDRFMMEIPIAVPENRQIRKSLMFNTRFHDADSLIEQVEPGVIAFAELNELSAKLQESIKASPVLEEYALDLWQATSHPGQYGVRIEGVEIEGLVLAGASPRGVGMLMRAARVNAWLLGREAMLPQDIHAVFHETVAHRLVLSPMYEMRRTELARELVTEIIRTVPVPIE